jgi:hypothetical protein
VGAENGPANTGTYFLDMCGNQNNNGGAIETTITTVPGRFYRIDFVGQPHRGCIGTAQTAQTQVTVYGVCTSSGAVVDAWVFDAPGNVQSWTPHSLTFQAIDTSATIEFRDVTTEANQCPQRWGCMLIDSVTVVSEILLAPEDCSGSSSFSCNSNSSGGDSSSMRSASMSMGKKGKDPLGDGKSGEVATGVDTIVATGGKQSSGTTVAVVAVVAVIVVIVAGVVATRRLSRSRSVTLVPPMAGAPPLSDLSSFEWDNDIEWGDRAAEEADATVV